jgi:hypothetical protein
VNIICYCGLAKSYHEPPHNLAPGHKYHPRYEDKTSKPHPPTLTLDEAGVERLIVACREAGHYWISTPLGDGSTLNEPDYEAQARAIVERLSADASASDEPAGRGEG